MPSISRRGWQHVGLTDALDVKPEPKQQQPARHQCGRKRTTRTEAVAYRQRSGNCASSGEGKTGQRPAIRVATAGELAAPADPSWARNRDTTAEHENQQRQPPVNHETSGNHENDQSSHSRARCRRAQHHRICGVAMPLRSSPPRELPSASAVNRPIGAGCRRIQHRVEIGTGDAQQNKEKTPRCPRCRSGLSRRQHAIKRPSVCDETAAPGVRLRTGPAVQRGPERPDTAC